MGNHVGKGEKNEKAKVSYKAEGGNMKYFLMTFLGGNEQF